MIMQLFGPHRVKPPKNSGIKGGNAGWMHVEYRGWPYVFIIARQDIAAGAELTIDYGEGCAACASTATASSVKHVVALIILERDLRDLNAHTALHLCCMIPCGFPDIGGAWRATKTILEQR
jgi:hypothetical protein